MAYNVRPDLAHDNLEMVWVELLLPHSKPILVGVCYRPEKVYTFWNIFEEFCVEKERFTNVQTIVIGDFIVILLENITLVYTNLSKSY